MAVVTEQSIERIFAKINADAGVSKKNKLILKRLERDLRTEHICLNRITKYLRYLSNFAVILKKDFDKATADDLKDLVVMIDKTTKWADYTKLDMKVILKRFYKWLSGDDEFPKKIKWLKPKLRASEKKLMPEDLLTQDDVKNMINNAGSVFRKAFIACLYESGCRITEFVSVKVKDVTFDDMGAVIRVNGKTGQRRIRLVISVPYLSTWANNHPLNDRESFLWVSMNRRIKPVAYERITEVGLRKLLQDTAKKAGVQKRVNPHSFRHARATHLATFLTEQELKVYLGWTAASKMAATYVHLSGKDIDNSILRANGIEVDMNGDTKPKMAVVNCTRCKTINPEGNKICQQCGTALDIKTAFNMDDKLNRILFVLKELDKRHPELQLNDVLDKEINS